MKNSSEFVRIQRYIQRMNHIDHSVAKQNPKMSSFGKLMILGMVFNRMHASIDLNKILIYASIPNRFILMVLVDKSIIIIPTEFQRWKFKSENFIYAINQLDKLVSISQ